MLIQQGDVLLKLIEGNEWIGCEGTAYLAKDNRCIIAEGEVSGHMHVAVGKSLMVTYPGTLLTFYDGSTRSDLFLIDSCKPFKLQHQEHKEITIPAGTWSVEKVKEYDHFKEGTTEVKD